LSNLRVFYAKALLSWGFMVRYRGTTAAQPAFPIPPPTTVVGAFAYPLAKMLKLSPRTITSTGIEWGKGKLISEAMKPFLEATITASAGFLSHKSIQTGLAVYQEPSRLIASPYKGGGEIERIKKAKFMESSFFEEALPRALPVQAIGAAYAPALIVELLWVIDVVKLSKQIGVSVDRIDNSAKKAVYGIVRIGSKESIVALENALYVENPKVIGPGEKMNSRLYMERACVEALDPTLTAEIIFPDLKFRLTPYYLPARISSNTIIIPLSEDSPLPLFRILDPCKAITIPSLEGVVGVARL